MTTEPDKAFYSTDEVFASSPPLTFGRALVAFRKAEELTQAQVALTLGITKCMLSQYETGRKLPSLALAERMATTLGLDVQVALNLLINDQLRHANLPYQSHLKTAS